MNTDKLELLIGYGEDSRIDRKISLRVDTAWHKAEFAKDIMAFANGHENQSAYILIGVGDDGSLHDVENLPDEATLQQIAASYLDPPVTFFLTCFTVRGARLAVIEIPHSEVRFHSAAKDVQQEKGKFLLHEGQVLIRRGTAKMPLKPLDYHLLKHGYAQRQEPQAKIDVCFAGETYEITTVRGWPIPSKVFLQMLTHVVIPPSTGHFDCDYQFIPLRFFVHNRGQKQSEAVVVDIKFPDNCQAVLTPPDERGCRAWDTKVIRTANRVRITGDRLVHGDYCWSEDVYVRFFRRDYCYTLDWTARTGNSVAPTQGTLQIKILANSP